MILTPVYHWSPRDRLKGIRRHGLLPGKPPTVGTVSAVHDEVQVICCSPDPLLAWRLSGDCSWAREVPVWDLWQVELRESDRVYIRSEFGPRVWEVRVANRIPKSRVRWLAERAVSTSIA